MLGKYLFAEQTENGETRHGKKTNINNTHNNNNNQYLIF